MKKEKKEIFFKIIKELKRYNPKKISVFGSYVRNEETSKSDIDIIVEFSGKKSLLELVGIEQELSEKLKMKVDLLTLNSISPYILPYIKKEEKVIYEKK